MKPVPVTIYDGTNTTTVNRINAPAGSVDPNGVLDLGLGVKVYRALLTQTNTDAPVATVLENTMGGTVVWTYSDVGTYAGTLAGAFTVDKTFCDGDTSWFNSSDLTGARVAYFAPSGTGNSVLLSTGIAAETLSDGLLANYAVEILVYP